MSKLFHTASRAAGGAGGGGSAATTGKQPLSLGEKNCLVFGERVSINLYLLFDVLIF